MFLKHINSQIFILMKNTFILFVSVILFTTSCGKKEGNSLADKKAQLADLQKQESTLAASIKKLQDEIQKLDTTTKVVKISSVAVTPLVAQNLQHFVEATGRLDAINNVFVSPQMGGALTAIYVKEGDYVAKGQKLATIDNTVLRSSMQEVEIQLETARTMFEKQKSLWEQKIGTEVQYIQAKAQVEALEKRIATVKSQDKMNVVLAPIAGYVDEVRQKAGELAAPGMGILRIVNTTELKVVANVPDTYAGTISKGDVVSIKFPDLQKEVKGRLSFVSQTINPVTRTFTVEASVPRDAQLKPNLTAILNVNDQSRANALVVPRNLIQRTENGDIVYVAVQEGKNKVARSRQIKTGLIYENSVEVVSGLATGELLITEGYQSIVDGQMVNY